MNRMLDAIPPTQDALLQHSLRTLYQGGHVWGQSTVASPIYPDPLKFGWVLDGETFKPLWTTLPSLSESCDELISCGCKTSCKGQCKCTRASLVCTAVCACDGDCFKDKEIYLEEVVEEDQEVDNVLDYFSDDDENN